MVGKRQASYITWLLFAIALIPLLSSPVLPFIDLYNHLARFYVLSNIESSRVLSLNYHANWSLLPNIGLDVICVSLFRLIPQSIFAHVVVIGIFATQYFGVLYFNRSLVGKASLLVAVLVIPLLYSYILNWGFANFLLGLGLVFWGAGWWVSQRENLQRALPVACIAAVIIFLTHGVAFALYGILIAALEIEAFLEKPQRGWNNLPAALAPVLVQAVIPIFLFIKSKTIASPDGLRSASDGLVRLMSFDAHGEYLWQIIRYRIVTLIRVEEGPTLWFDCTTLLIQIGLCVVLARRGKLVIPRAGRLAVIVAAFLVVVCPPTMFGSGYVSDRMPLFFGMLLVGCIRVEAVISSADRPVIIGISAVVILRLLAISWDWQTYSRDAKEFGEVAALIPKGSLVHDVIVGGNFHGSDVPRCEMYRPMLVSHYGQIAGLFAVASAQPLEIVGPLRAALDRLPRNIRASSSDLRDLNSVIAAAGPAGFDYLLICRAENLKMPFPPNSLVIAHTPLFTLLKVR